MSLISDALKEARKGPPGSVPRSVPPPPTAHTSAGLLGWFLPGLAVALILAAIFFIGWAVVNHRSSRPILSSQTAANPPARTMAVAQPPATDSPPTVPDAAAAPPESAASAPPSSPPPAMPLLPLPKLQGIFYSPSAPSAIIDGKSVKSGDLIHGYTVKAIARSAVTLIGPDQKEVQLNFGN